MTRGVVASPCSPGALWLAVLLGAAPACASNAEPPDAAPACPSRVASPLIEAASEETYLGLAPSQARAVVALVDGSGESDALCSGVAVTSTWVLGAAHCAEIASPSARVMDASGGAVLVPVTRVQAHPSLDLALFELGFSAAGAADLLELGVTPLLVARALDVDVGDAVELAGVGRTEAGTAGKPAFLVELLVEVDASSLRVDGFGITGACDGDSGGPLLARASDGALVVQGILTSGDATCRGRDRAVRLDRAADWVETTTGGAPVAGPLECGSVGSEGRCFGSAAAWCEQGALRTADCSSLGLRCGWEPTELGFRCVPPGADACAGSDGVGRCEGRAAVICTGGVRFASACGACAACRVDGRTGAPYCAAAE